MPRRVEASDHYTGGRLFDSDTIDDLFITTPETRNVTMTSETFTLSVGGDIEPGTYPAMLIGWEPFILYQRPDGSWSREEIEGGDPVTFIEWKFNIADVGDVSGTTSTATSKRSKLRAWSAGLGLDIATVRSVDAEALVGREGLITVVLKDDGYAKVDSIVPLPKAKKA